jgi:hypothetical protein
MDQPEIQKELVEKNAFFAKSVISIDVSECIILNAYYLSECIT